MTRQTLRIALLIDADNSPADLIDEILTELSTMGVIDIRRAYGNWTKPALHRWQARLLEFAIRPMQQFDYSKGKNASDMAMTVDAMELLYTERPDAFALASSDADFTPLVMHLRAKGAAVYGFGAVQTPKPFVNACSRFLYLEALRDAMESPEPVDVGDAPATAPDAPASASTSADAPVRADAPTPPSAGVASPAAAKKAPVSGGAGATASATATASAGAKLPAGAVAGPVASAAEAPLDGAAPVRTAGLRVPTSQLRQNTRLMNGLRSAVQANADEAGWVRVGELGHQIANKESFDARNYGYGTLSKLLVATDAFELRDEGTSRVAARLKAKR